MAEAARRAPDSVKDCRPQIPVRGRMDKVGKPAEEFSKLIPKLISHKILETKGLTNVDMKTQLSL